MGVQLSLLLTIVPFREGHGPGRNRAERLSATTSEDTNSKLSGKTGRKDNMNKIITHEYWDFFKVLGFK